MPKLKLSFEIKMTLWTVEVDEQRNNAALPRGNIRFQGKPHTSCLIFSKSFLQKNVNHTHFNILCWAASVPVQLLFKITNRKCNISSISARDTFDETQHCNIAMVTVGTNQNVIVFSIKEPGSQRNNAEKQMSAMVKFKRHCKASDYICIRSQTVAVQKTYKKLKYTKF